MLGIVAIIAIQRAVQKILISVFLSRELKHEETNRAWWSGKWYGRGLGSSAFSQPAREFVVKIVEMSLWTSDFLLAHLLLIIMTPPMFIPFVDKLHSTMMCTSQPRLPFVPVADFLHSLVEALEADSSTTVLYEAEAPAEVDRTLTIPLPKFFITNCLFQVLKYSLVYIIVVAFLAALIVLRTSHFDTFGLDVILTALLQPHCSGITSRSPALYARISNLMPTRTPSSSGLAVVGPWRRALFHALEHPFPVNS